MEDLIYDVKNLNIHFPLAQSFNDMIKGKEKKYVRAVDDVSFGIKKHEIVSLVGESGSGKSTIGKALLRLIDDKALSGEILFENNKLYDMNKIEMQRFRQHAQMIFQDPYQALNPKHTNYDTVAEALVVNKLCKDKRELRKKVLDALDMSGLKPPENYIDRYSHELSGGQRQRIAIAGAMILNPDFIVADEPVSMLDVSVRAGILKLIVKLREEKGVSCLFITHDLSLAWLISDRIAILYLGKIMEIGTAEEIVSNPCHPYSKALLDVMPILEPRHGKKRIVLKGEIPDPTEAPKGCRFSSRCPMAKDICRENEPKSYEVSSGHCVSCHFADEIYKNGFPKTASI